MWMVLRLNNRSTDLTFVYVGIVILRNIVT